MDTPQIVYAIAIALCGGLLQGTAAFGFGLFSVPLLLTIGLPPPSVLALASVCAAVQSASGIHRLRHVVPWKAVGYSLAVRATTMFLGIWVLRKLADYPTSLIKFWIGLVVFLMVLLQATWQPRPRARLHNGWNLAAFSASGFTSGLCSMGGPPLVLWVMAHDWTAERTRAFLFASFMSLIPLQLVVLYWTFGYDVVRGMILGIALLPAVLAGSAVGLHLGGRLSKPLLRRLAFLLLGAIALSAMVPQLSKLMGRP